MEGARLKFGLGATAELGFEARQLSLRRVMLVTDSDLAALPPVEQARSSLAEAGVEAVLFDAVRVEPSDHSFLAAAEFAAQGQFDGFVAVGGGSVIDTAKAANLYATYPADLMEYVNAPIGRGSPVPGPLAPLIAVPTTSGTGSETTGIAIFDLTERRVKTGIAHRALRPVLGIIDPAHTASLPATAVAATGLDVLSHAIESYTALPFTAREAAAEPGLRPAYQGANPISDVWAAKALQMVARYLERAVADADDTEARGQMLMAASFAGYGFGNAGVHLPHGMSYPVSSMVAAARTDGGYQADGYPSDHPLLPHGISVILNAPAVFAFTAAANPRRHLDAAGFLGADTAGVDDEDAGEVLAGRIVEVMRAVGAPSGLAAVGFAEGHIDALVAGTLPQHRVTKLSPRPADEAELRQLFTAAMRYW